MSDGLSYDVKRRLELLAEEWFAARARSIQPQGDRFVVRIELSTEGRRVSMLSAVEHDHFTSLIEAGRRKLATAFGDLEWSELVPSWNGSVGGVRLSIYARGAISRPVLGKLEAALTDALSEEKQVLAREAIGRGLYALYCRSWVEDGDTPNTRDEFVARPTLRGISVKSDAPSEILLEWDDKGLFGDHAIFVVVKDDKVRDGSLDEF